MYMQRTAHQRKPNLKPSLKSKPNGKPRSRKHPKRVERRNGTKPPAGVRVFGGSLPGAMARLKAARITALNFPGRDGADFLDEALHIERGIAAAADFQRARP